MASWNCAGSIDNIENHLYSRIDNYQIDVLHLCETEVRMSKSDVNMCLRHFTNHEKIVVRNLFGERGGKFCRNVMAVREGVFESVERMWEVEANRAEIWLKCKRPGIRDVLIIGVYNEWTRPASGGSKVPGVDQAAFLEQIEKHSQYEILLVGDMNIQLNEVQNDNKSYPHYKRGKEYVGSLEQCGLDIHGVGVTFRRKHTESNGKVRYKYSEIDWVASNAKDTITRRRWIKGVSDHAIVYSDIFVGKDERSDMVQKRIMSGLYTKECIKHLWDKWKIWEKFHGHEKDPNDLVNSLQHIIEETKQIFAPIRMVRRRSTNIRAPPNSRVKRIKIRQLRGQGKIKEANKLHREITKERRRMSHARIVRDLEQGKETIYSLYDRFTKKPLHTISVRDRSGRVVNGEKAAKALADTFEKKLEDLKSRCNIDLNNLQLPLPRGEFNFKPISPKQTLKLIKKLKKSHSTDTTGIPQSAFKCWAEVMCFPLSRIINRSFETGDFPNAWKVAKIVPIYKGTGDRLDTKFYRPLSMLHPATKVLELAVCEQITDFLEKKGLLPRSQHGFRRKRSTTSAAADLIDWIDCQRNEGKKCGLLIFDYSSAFDMISNEVLKKKLESLGATAKVRDWFFSYTSDRTMRVCVDGEYSDEFKVASLIPQGSSLSPITYLAYVFDVANKLDNDKVKTVGYADDTSTGVAGEGVKDLISTMETICDKMNDYSSKNGMCLNLKKTEWMLFDKTTNTCPLKVEGGNVKKSEHLRFLGIHLSNKWDGMAHLDAIERSIWHRISRLRRLSFYLPTSILRRHIQPHVLSKLEYGMDLYADITKITTSDVDPTPKVVKRMEVLAKEAVRAVFGIKRSQYNEYSSERLWKMGNIKPIRNRLLEKSLLSAFDILAPTGKWRWMALPHTEPDGRPEWREEWHDVAFNRDHNDGRSWPVGASKCEIFRARRREEKGARESLTFRRIRLTRIPGGNSLRNRSIYLWGLLTRGVQNIKKRHAFAKQIREKSFQLKILRKVLYPHVVDWPETKEKFQSRLRRSINSGLATLHE